MASQDPFAPGDPFAPLVDPFAAEEDQPAQSRLRQFLREAATILGAVSPQAPAASIVAAGTTTAGRVVGEAVLETGREVEAGARLTAEQLLTGATPQVPASFLPAALELPEEERERALRGQALLAAGIAGAGVAGGIGGIGGRLVGETAAGALFGGLTGEEGGRLQEAATQAVLFAGLGVAGEAAGVVGRRLLGAPRPRGPQLAARGSEPVPRVLPEEQLRRARLPDPAAQSEIALQDQLDLFGVANREAADEALTLRKFNLGQEAEGRLADETARIVRERPGLRRPVSIADTQRAASELGVQDIARLTPETLDASQLLATRNLIKGNAEEMVTLSKRLRDQSLRPTERTALQQQVDGLLTQNSELIGKFVKARSAAGRNLNALRSVATSADGLDQAFWLGRAHSIVGDSEWQRVGDRITEQVVDAITRRDVNGPRGLLAVLENIKRPAGLQRLIAFWKAGLLTNPKTHVVNTTSNTAFAMLEAARERPSAVLDYLIGLGTGVRTRGFVPLREELSIIRQGVLRGIERAGKVIRGELDEFQKIEVRTGRIFRRFDDPGFVESIRQGKVRSVGNALGDSYMNFVFKTLQAEDQIFKGLAIERSFRNQARARAAAMGLRGKAATEEAVRLVRQPDDAMWSQSLFDADVATFQDPTALGEALQNLNRRIPVLNFFIPFARTPGAIATRVLEFVAGGPLGVTRAVGALRAAARGRRFGTLPAELPEITRLQRGAVDVLGRQATGASLMALGWWLADKGLAIGRGPRFGTREREVFDAAGMQENAVLGPDGRWHNIGRLAPGGNIIATGASLYQAINDPSLTPLAKFLAAPAEALRTVGEQPFVTGLRELSRIVEDPTGASQRTADQLVGSIVPAGVAALARSVDPRLRETRAELPASDTELQEQISGSLRNTFNQILSRVPVASRILPARINAFGEEIERTPGLIANLLDPTSPRVLSEDPVIQEMARVRAGVPRLKRREDESFESFQARQRILGLSVQAVVAALHQTPLYLQADQIAAANPAISGDDIRRELTDMAVNAARREIFRALPGPSQPRR